MIKTLLLLVLFVARLVAAPFVTAGTTVIDAKQITGAGTSTVSGVLVFGGLGESPTPDWAGKVVLLDRGVISYADKVKKAAAAGAVAVIIANTSNPSNVATLAPDSSTIPALSVSQAEGATLKSKVGESVRVGTAAPPPPPAAALPDPVGRKGEIVASDGEKFILQKSQLPPSVAMSSEVEVGKRLAFSVITDGTPPFSYQWIKDGANLEGRTTAVLSIESVAPGDAGSYVCQVSNSFGAAPSAPHNVTIK